MLGARSGFGEVPWFWSDQYDLTGRWRATSWPTSTLVSRRPVSSSFTLFYLGNGALRGVAGVNRPRDVRAATRLIETGQTVDPAQLADQSVDLRKIGL